jgi:hypothetical protein
VTSIWIVSNVPIVPDLFSTLKYHYPKFVGLAEYIETLPALLYQFSQFIAVHEIKFQFDKLHSSKTRVPIILNVPDLLGTFKTCLLEFSSLSQSKDPNSSLSN